MANHILKEIEINSLQEVELNSVDENEMLVNENLIHEASDSEVLIDNIEIVDALDVSHNYTVLCTITENEVQEQYDTNIKIKGKKRARDVKKWKRNKDKENNLKGFKDKFRRRNIPVCRCNCADKLSNHEQEFLYKVFRSLKSSTEQSLYLRGCLRPVYPKRHRSSSIAPARRVFKYEVKTSKGELVSLCQQAFTAIFGIQRSRLMKKVQNFDIPIEDNRGKHENHRKYDDEILDKVHEYLSNLPCRESHYTRHNNKKTQYLSSELNISILRKNFLEMNPQMQISDFKFRQIFNYDFNYSFGLPRKDICNICSKFDVDIEKCKLENTNKNNVQIEQLKIQKEIHLRKAQCFFDKIKELKMDTTNTLAICFDYQKNLPLPVTNCQDEYYRRQLWLHNFGIHDLKSGNVTMYLYSEYFTQKSPDEVISCLDDYLGFEINGNTYENLVLFCDNCYSQNKNRFLFCYLDNLCQTNKFKQIEVFYPIPGHSMMPIDSDFGAVERKKRKSEKVYSPEKYLQMIKSCKLKHPIKINFVNYSLRDNMDVQDEERIIKVLNYKSLLNKFIKPSISGISTARILRFARGEKPKMKASYNGIFNNFSLYKNKISKTHVKMSPDIKFNDFLTLKSAKYDDIFHLLKFVPIRYHKFYETLKKDQNAPQKNPVAVEDEDEFE